MEGIKRKPLQGLSYVLRFNWHYYFIALVFILVLFFIKSFLSAPWHVWLHVFIALSFIATLFSLFATVIVYDFSNLYKLNWLDTIAVNENALLVNIHAGFDETSFLLAQKYPTSILKVFDFYDEKKHTEVSIKRARKLQLIYPGTVSISTNEIPLANHAADIIFLILSAHEIRQTHERILFFQRLNQKLKNNGYIVVVEHLRNFANFVAYNFGCFHFHSKKEWKRTFANAGFILNKQLKITPFVHVFILNKNGTAS